MPSIASHFACASRVSDIIKISSDDFYFGNILPDLLENLNSHYKVRGTYYLIPNLKDFLGETEFTGDMLLGYICHLMLDKYFLEEYVPNNILVFDKENIFSSSKIYNDYTVLNPKLLKMFNLDLIYLNKILCTNWPNIDNDKLKKNNSSLNTLENAGKLRYIEFNSYIEFLESISIVIAQDIIKMMPTLKQKIYSM